MTAKVHPDLLKIAARCPFFLAKKGKKLNSKELTVIWSISRSCDPATSTDKLMSLIANDEESLRRADELFENSFKTPPTCASVGALFRGCRGCRWNDCQIVSPIELGFDAEPKPKEEPKLTDWGMVSASRFLTPPPKREYVFSDLLPRGIVGAVFAAGGTGKSFLMLQLALSLATGKAFSIFRPAKKARTLYLGAEDSEDELHRRVFAIARESGTSAGSYDLTSNFGALSICGSRGPLIAFDGNGNAAVTDTYHWLDEALESLKPEVLILDPMSRLFGLSENDNADATAFVACLEKLARKHDLTVLFCHHESKAASGNRDLQQNSGRGASAFIDGCRWALVMRNMTPEDGKTFEVNCREHVELDIRKSNYAAKLPASSFLKRGQDGVLLATNLSGDLRNTQIVELVRLIAEAPEPLSKNQLTNEEAGTSVSSAMKARFPKFVRSKDMPLLICRALDDGLLQEITVVSGKKPRTVLQVRNTLENNTLEDSGNLFSESGNADQVIN